MITKYVLCLFCFWSFKIQSAAAVAPSGSAVCIEHLGYTNKPILPIVISDSSAAATACSKDAVDRTEGGPPWTNRLSRNQMASLIQNIIKIPSNVTDQRKAFGDFAVVIFDHGAKHVVFIDKSAMIDLLNLLRGYCQGDDQLCKQLDDTKARLSP